MKEDKKELIEMIEKKVLDGLSADRDLQASDIHTLVSIFGRARAVLDEADQRALFTETDYEVYRTARARIREMIERTDPAHDDLQRLVQLVVSFAKLESIVDGGPYGFASC